MKAPYGSPLSSAAETLFEKPVWNRLLELNNGDHAAARRSLKTLGQCNEPPIWLNTLDPRASASVGHQRDREMYEISREIVSEFRRRLISGDLQLMGFHGPTHSWMHFEPATIEGLKFDFEANAVDYHGQTYGSCHIAPSAGSTPLLIDRAMEWLVERRKDKYPGRLELQVELRKALGPSFTDKIYEDLLKRAFNLNPGQKIVSHW